MLVLLATCVDGSYAGIQCAVRAVLQLGRGQQLEKRD